MKPIKEILPMFPKPILKTSMDRAFTDDEIKFMSSQILEQGIGNSSSKNRRILDAPELVDLKRIAKELLDYWTKDILLIGPELTLEITQSWMNTTKPGEYHHNHYHPNSVVSGIFYIEADKNKDQFMVLDPTPTLIKYHTISNNVFNSEEYHLPIEKGNIVLFPSLIYHGVPHTQTNTNRISLAFNSFWKGKLGFANDSTNYLEINSIR